MAVRSVVAMVCCLLLAACDFAPLSDALSETNETAVKTDASTSGDSDAGPRGTGGEHLAGGKTAKAGPRADAPVPADMDGVAYDGPLTISEGGTYTGNWESTDADTPAVSIETTEPVRIEGANIRSRGDLIASGVEGVHVSVVNSAGLGLDPGVPGEVVGRFVSLRRARRALIEGNEFASTAGIEFVGYGGDRSAGQTFKVRYNRARNIDGRVSSGNGLSADDDAADLRQFVQLNEVVDVPGIEVAWNEVRNDPGESRVEDNVSVWLSSGTPGSPIDIHHNFIDGAYPVNPESDDYSGGGIMGSDGVGDGVPAHVVIRDNRVVNTTNYGIAISSGRNITLEDNRVLSTGLLPSGEPISAQNVGAYVWNMHGADFGGHTVTGNVVGWEKDGGRNDFFFPDADTAGNTSFDGDVTDKVLDDEYDAWTSEADAAGAVVGISQ